MKYFLLVGIYKKGGEEEYCIRDGTTQEQNSPFGRFFSRIIEEALLDTRLYCVLNMHQKSMSWALSRWPFIMILCLYVFLAFEKNKI